MAKIRLKAGREKPLLRRHPWVFSGAIDKVEGEPGMGETTAVVDSNGEFLAWAGYSPSSQIRARVWHWCEEDVVGREMFAQQIEKALRLRSSILVEGLTDAVRLIHAESDGLPGLVVDKYGDALVVQFLTAGVEFWRDVIVELLREVPGVETVYERSDADVRGLEGLEPRSGVLVGSEFSRVKIKEKGLSYWVDLDKGHKTGFYLDQRDNRLAVRGLAGGRTVLDCFSYTGGFGVNALAGGAEHVTMVDVSGESLAMAKENLELNGFEENQYELVEADVFEQLRKYRDSRKSFDMIILDPPKFAPTRAQVERAARGYKDINLLAFKLLRQDGILATFSCSGGVGADLFQKIVAGAALDAGVDVQIIDRLQQGSDHPVSLNFPEGAYLKGLVCRVG